MPPPNTDPTTATELALPGGTLDGDATGTDFAVWFRFDPTGPTSITFTVVDSNGQAYLTGQTATDSLFEDVPAGEYTFEATETTWVQLYTDVPGPYSIAWSGPVAPGSGAGWAVGVWTP